MATNTATRGRLEPPRSAMPMYSHAARAARPATASVISQRGPRKTSNKTSGIRIRAVRIRFIPRVRIHCQGGAGTRWRAGERPLRQGNPKDFAAFQEIHPIKPKGLSSPGSRLPGFQAPAFFRAFDWSQRRKASEPPLCAIASFCRKRFSSASFFNLAAESSCTAAFFSFTTGF